VKIKLVLIGIFSGAFIGIMTTLLINDLCVGFFTALFVSAIMGFIFMIIHENELKKEGY
jgi:ABC-type uncharacterized transport system permease subunit